MSVSIPAQLRRQVRETFGQRCAYCLTAEELTVTTFEIDHIIPLQAGGATTPENLCLACPTCNRHKATRQRSHDPDTGQVVTLFHPRRQTWSDHFAWTENGTQMIGLTPTGRATVAALQTNRPQMVRVRRLWMKLGKHPPAREDESANLS